MTSSWCTCCAERVWHVGPCSWVHTTLGLRCSQATGLPDPQAIVPSVLHATPVRAVPQRGACVRTPYIACLYTAHPLIRPATPSHATSPFARHNCQRPECDARPMSHLQGALGQEK